MCEWDGGMERCVDGIGDGPLCGLWISIAGGRFERSPFPFALVGANNRLANT
jgi:hypothetical protein